MSVRSKPLQMQPAPQDSNFNRMENTMPDKDTRQQVQHQQPVLQQLTLQLIAVRLAAICVEREVALLAAHVPMIALVANSPRR